ncbi:phosphoadenosine phosphosulfate reductase [Albirhodobacter sp. R86504]|uniref:phosphoadenosine phosphosulfate reductase n=1 Tax=Albirhodobacter sp. R86504 TaxID=3093848 RepID=UPI003673220A
MPMTKPAPNAADAAPERDANELAWWDSLELIGDDAGYYEPLGQRHGAFFSDQGTTLLVTFERAEDIRGTNPDQLPMAFGLTKPHGWSSLTLICDGDTWFRDPAVYAYFDRLVDDAFFEDFERVVFYGAGACGYAAAAFSVTAPGATVIAVQPQATLDPQIAGWDQRFLDQRRTSFADRYGFAPDMLEGAGQGFVVFDPSQTMDAMHAALFTRPYVTKLSCPYLGPRIEQILTEMDVLTPCLEAACAGTFDALTFWKLYRARRNAPRYLRGLTAVLDQKGRPLLAAILCRNVVERLNGPRFRSRLAELEEQLAKDGLVLPPLRETA